MSTFGTRRDDDRRTHIETRHDQPQQETSTMTAEQLQDLKDHLTSLFAPINKAAELIVAEAERAAAHRAKWEEEDKARGRAPVAEQPNPNANPPEAVGKVVGQADGKTPAPKK